MPVAMKRSIKCILLGAFLSAAIGCTGYDACGGKECGDPCNQCDPDDSDCVESAEFKVCSDRLLCVAAPSSCSG